LRAWWNSPFHTFCIFNNTITDDSGGDAVHRRCRLITIPKERTQNL
jgi:hypothetical protein